MPLDWSPFVKFVHRHQRFFLTTHVRPDGDGLGSILALGEALEGLGKRVDLTIPSVLPPRYAFLDPQKKIQVYSAPGDRFRDCDAVIVMDTGTWNQLAEVGQFVRSSSAEKLVIDHHRTQDDLGAIAMVDVSAEATGRLTFEAIQALQVSISATMAKSLFVALAMDTGWFMHSNTTPESFRLAGDLAELGAATNDIKTKLFERSTLARQKLKGVMLSRIRMAAQSRIAFSYIQFSDYAETGAIPLDTEDFIDELRSIDGVEIAFLLLEQRENAAKASFRSRTVDVAKLAERFHGGGHKLASGATLPGPLGAASETVLAAAIEAIESSSLG